MAVRAKHTHLTVVQVSAGWPLVGRNSGKRMLRPYFAKQRLTLDSLWTYTPFKESGPAR